MISHELPRISHESLQSIHVHGAANEYRCTITVLQTIEYIRSRGKRTLGGGEGPKYIIHGRIRALDRPDKHTFTPGGDDIPTLLVKYTL